MELTQIKGDSLGSKINLVNKDLILLPMPKGTPEQKQESIGKIENIEGKQILTPHENIETTLNNEKITEPTEIEHGDTIKIGDNKTTILAAHKPGEVLTQEKIEEHLEKVNSSISSEEMFHLINAIQDRQNLFFNFSKIFVVILLIIISGLSYNIYILKSENQNILRDINNYLFPTKNNFDQLKNLIGKPENQDKNISERLNNLENSDAGIKQELVNVKSYETSLKEVQEKIENLNGIISSSELKPEIKEQITNLIQSFVTDFSNQLDLSNKIASFGEDAKKIEYLQEEIKKVEDLNTKISSIQQSFDSLPKENTGQNGEEIGNAIRTLLNEITKLREEINKIKASKK